MWPQKRYKDLIWAADLLKCIRDDVHLIIVGDGPQRWRLEKFRDQVQITDRVHFLGERPDAKEIISCLDCFWLASDYEGQSNALMEAMASGVPVVASDIPGNRDLVIPDETGYLVEVETELASHKKQSDISTMMRLRSSLARILSTESRMSFLLRRWSQDTSNTIANFCRIDFQATARKRINFSIGQQQFPHLTSCCLHKQRQVVKLSVKNVDLARIS